MHGDKSTNLHGGGGLGVLEVPLKISWGSCTSPGTRTGVSLLQSWQRRLSEQRMRAMGAFQEYLPRSLSFSQTFSLFPRPFPFPSIVRWLSACVLASLCKKKRKKCASTLRILQSADNSRQFPPQFRRH